MYRRKLRNLSKIWEEANFSISYYDEKVEGNKVLELNLQLMPMNGQSVEFDKNWDDVKHAGSRQAFYAMPVSENAQDELSNVRLVDRDSIYQMHERFSRFVKLSESSYWALQGDLSVKAQNDTAMNLGRDIHQVQLHIRRMKNSSAHSHLFKNRATVGLWDNYKKEVREWVAGVLNNDYVTDECKEIAKIIHAHYSFED